MRLTTPRMLGCRPAVGPSVRLIALFVAVASCSFGGPADTGTPLAEATGGEGGVWGPLAVVDDSDRSTLTARGGAGPLRIGRRCVTLLVEESGNETTLVWRSGQTRWDPLRPSIIFRDPRLGEIRLSNGDRIEIGGAGLADPESPDQGAPQRPWLSPPHGSCPSRRWVVHSVNRLDR